MHMPSFRRRLLPAALLAAVASLAHADDQSAVSLSGFGTLGVAHKADRDSDFVASVLQSNGAGHNRPTSIHPDSRLGLQLSGQAGPWSGVLQLVSEEQIDNSYRPHVEWANVKYQLTPDLAVRAGRIALPVFLAADYRKVGYAYPWVRTPVEVYGAIPISNSDGIDATWRWNTGDIKHSTQFIFGRNRQKTGDVTHLDARRLVGLSDTVTWGAFTGRLSLLTTELTVDLVRSSFDLYRSFGPTANALADRWDADHKRTDGFAAGLAYDPGTWFVQAEIGRANTRSYLGDRTAFYVSGGLRQGDVTPYLSYASVRPNMPTQVPGMALAGLPPPLQVVAAQLNAGLNAALHYVADQDTVSAGLRWDLRSSVALKFQLDRIRPHGDSYGTFIYIQPGYRGRPANVASATLDFVF